MAPDAANQGGPPQEPVQGADAQPKRLGGFELLGRLGKGGMGTVLKARQVSMDRLVALKILPQKLAKDERFVQRFLREARSAAKLRHPNIVQAFDVGQTEGHYFFAMEFVDGETLADVVRRDGPLEANRALDVMKQVASALAAAHKEGIVHRDIKPSNIMIDKEGQVRVTDFGLAKRTEGDVAVTADGAVVGTPAYVAPEMAKGGEAESRSDLYSLGATIFCALAGRPPFEGKNFSEVLVKQAMEQAPPLASLAPRVDRRLCHVIDRLLRKNPEGRFPSAKALLDDLNGLGKLQSVAAAARAEGRAMIAEAPTLEVTEGKRRAREAAAPRPTASGRRPTTLIAVGAIVAILAIAGLVMALRPGPKQMTTDHGLPTTDQGKEATAKTPKDAKKPSVPDNRQPKTEHPTPPVRPKVEETPKPKVEPVPEPKAAAEWAKWDAIKADARKLIDAGKLDEAAKLLDGAKALPLDGIADLVAEQMESIESAKRKAAATALAAYQAESDKLWALFKQRDYAEADALLKQLAADPRFGVRRSAAEMKGVRPAGAENNIRVGDADSLADHLKADQEAGKLLKEFWAAVERGVAARKGTISIEGAVGNITGVENGIITIQTANEPAKRRVLDLKAKQALTYAAVVLKDDERSHLAEAIFRIAEGEDPALAEKALAAAGNPPSLSCYKDRLAALTLGAGEVAARKAWAEIEALGKDKLTKAQTATLGNLLGKFEKEHGQSKTGKGVADQIAALRARVGKAAEPIVYTEWPFDAAEAKRRQLETAKVLGVPIEQGIDLGNGVKMTFVLIPAGEFLMGSPPTTSPERLAAAYGGTIGSGYQSEFPQHRVRISHPFWMSKHLVTQEQWVALFGTNPSRFNDDPKKPVEQVDWSQAQEFAKLLSEKLGRAVRLPTEAEWEYACRAGMATEFYFGNDAARVADFSWPGAKTTAPVGMKKPNAWGLHDMIGTVWQWCGDWYGDYGGADLVDPAGPAGGRDRIIRGGHYGDPPGARRSAHRTGIKAGTRLGHVGFRVVLCPEPRQGVEVPKAAEWQNLFDGKMLEGWKVVAEGMCAEHGKVGVQDGHMVLEPGKPLTGVKWTGNFPSLDYEVTLEAMCTGGGGNWCNLTFPVGTSGCSLAMLGIGESKIGLDQVDGAPATRNLTTRKMSFAQDRWYRVRVRATKAAITVSLDDAEVIALDLEGHKVGVVGRIWGPLMPFGVANWESTTALRNIRVRRIAPAAAEAPKAGEWQSLFDGKTLGGWQKFEGHGDMGTVSVKDGQIVVGMGNVHAGIVWTQDFPKCDYELEMKVSDLGGYQTPCQLTFPVQDSFCTLFYRGGTAASLSKIGGKDFGVPGGKPGAEKQWYALRLRVTKAKIGVWVDRRQVLDVAIPEGAEITCDKADWRINRLNIRTWKTSAAYRDLRVRSVGAE